MLIIYKAKEWGFGGSVYGTVTDKAGILSKSCGEECFLAFLIEGEGLLNLQVKVNIVK